MNNWTILPFVIGTSLKYGILLEGESYLDARGEFTTPEAATQWAWNNRHTLGIVSETNALPVQQTLFRSRYYDSGI